jgi:hypothetical protein
MNNLILRRAIFVYQASRLAAIAANAPIIPVVWRDREKSFRQQFLKVIHQQCGLNRLTSPEQLHDKWVQEYVRMGWKYGENYDREKKIHPDIVPYNELNKLERDKDEVFVALCEIARQWIY